MAINAVQVAWISHLTSKGVIRPGASIVEFSPQDILCSRRAVERYGSRHQTTAVVASLLEEIFDGEKPRTSGIPPFYRLFGIERYRSTDLLDPRADWMRDFNRPVKLPKKFDIATNFGTAEHVFDIGQMFRSMHDALLPGGVALYVLPAFGDINHGFYNIHPTTYFDLAGANGYIVEDFYYVDRWDVRNRALEANLDADVDFDALPIGQKEVLDRSVLQRLVTETFIANYQLPDTRNYGADFPSVLYDYCVCALRKVGDSSFRVPLQKYYGGGALLEAVPRHPAILWLRARLLAVKDVALAVRRRIPIVARLALRPLNPIRARLKLRTRFKRLIGRA